MFLREHPAFAPGLVGLMGLVLVVGLLQRPAPLFLNLGAGDEAFARGFRGGWERDGLQQTGETQFRWTQDGARLEIPLRVGSGRLAARLRFARFSAQPVEMAAFVGEQEVDRWVQPPRGWQVRTVDLGDVRGPLVLRFRSSSPDGEALGIALDWIEVGGAGRVLPPPRLLAGLFGLFLVAPVVLAVLADRRLGVAAALIVAGVGAAAVLADRLGAIVALGRAGVPALLAIATLALADRLAQRRWPDPSPSPFLLVVPIAAVVVTLVALLHPFFYYPDVDTHARYLAGVRADASLLWDAREFQARTGAWTREVGGHRIAFPYSPVFHLLAWPLAPVLGEVGAIKTVAVTAVGMSLVLVHLLGRSVGLSAPAAILAQLLFAVLPVTSSRLTLALFPALLGQCAELGLFAYLAQRFLRLDHARDAVWAVLFLLLGQAAHTASVFNVTAAVGFFVLIEVAVGDRGRAWRLAAACAVAAALMIALYGRFIPLLWSVVGSGAGRPSSGAGGVAGGLFLAIGRFRLFYDVAPGLLVAASIAWLRSSPRHARHLVLSVLSAGLLLLLLRYHVPVVFRDAREVELLLAPIAILAAAGLSWFWDVGYSGRLVAVAATGWIAAWSAAAAAAAYGERFVAIGR